MKENEKVKNSLISTYGKLPVWINWELKHIGLDEGKPEFKEDGSPKMTKIPRCPANGSFASVSNPNTWSTHEQAALTAPKYSGIGLVFTGVADMILKSASVGMSTLEPKYHGDEIVGVDLDHYLENGKLTDDRVLDFYVQANTFCSKSQSGTGLHFYFVTESPDGTPEPFIPSMNKKTGSAPFEVYSSRDSNGVKKGRYFAETGAVFGEDKALRHVTVKELVDLLKILGYEESTDTDTDTNTVENSVLSSISEGELNGYVSPFSSDVHGDEDLLEAMFKSKNGTIIKAIYDGDASKWKGDLSSADESLCSSLAFWTGKNKERIRNIWLKSPLAQREKTQKRVDYQNSTIDYAIKGCKEVYSRGVVDTSPNVPEEGWIMSNTKFPYPLFNGAGGTTNIYRLLERDPKYATKIRRNEFSHQPEVFARNSWVDLTEEYVRDFMIGVSENYPPFTQVAEKTIVDAIMTVADKHKVNPIKEFILSLTWDKVSRLDQWLYRTYHCPDDEIHQQMGAFFIMGMMSRILTPGRQFDTCLCLVSGQGMRKSSSLRILGSSPSPDVSWHVEHTGGVSDKDFGMIMAKNILVEFSEGAVTRKDDSETVKSILSKTQDQFRLPYGKVVQSFPRGCVFALTTNNPQFLRDDSGNRRYLIVRFDKAADLEWLRENRDQLFAEATYRLTVNKEKFWWDAGEGKELEEIQAASTTGNIYDEAIVSWYERLSPERRKEGVLPLEAFNDIFGVDEAHPKEASWSMSNTITSTFKRMLFLERGSTRLNITGKGESATRWLMSDKTKSSLDLTNTKARPAKGSLDEYIENVVEDVME